MLVLCIRDLGLSIVDTVSWAIFVVVGLSPALEDIK